MHSTNTTGRENRNHLGNLVDLPIVVASEYVDWEPDWFRVASGGEDHPASTGPRLSHAEERFLKAVVSNPGRRASAYPRLAKVGARKALQMRKRLLDLAYIREHQVNIKRRGRPPTFLEPTGRGCDASGMASETKGD